MPIAGGSDGLMDLTSTGGASQTIGGGRADLTSAGLGTGHSLTPAVEIIDSKNASGSGHQHAAQPGQGQAADVASVSTPDNSSTADPASGHRTLTANSATVQGVAVSSSNTDEINTYSPQSAAARSAWRSRQRERNRHAHRGVHRPERACELEPVGRGERPVGGRLVGERLPPRRAGGGRRLRRRRRGAGHRRDGC